METMCTTGEYHITMGVPEILDKTTPQNIQNVYSKACLCSRLCDIPQIALMVIALFTQTKISVAWNTLLHALLGDETRLTGSSKDFLVYTHTHTYIQT